MPTAARIHQLLVVDDDLLVCELLTQLLRGKGFVVTATHSADEAIFLLRDSGLACDAVLTDLQMPGVSGLELAQHLRSTVDSPLLIGMSARAPDVQEEQVFDAFLQKPFTLADLEQLLDELANSVRATQERDVAAGRDAAVKSSLPESGSTSAGTHPASREGEDSARTGSLEAILDLDIFGKLRAAVGPAQLSQLYEMTANDVDSRLLRMRESLRTENDLELRNEAHAIKGGCSMVGAIELSRLAARAELGSETDSAHLDEMAEACRRLRRMVTIVPP